MALFLTQNLFVASGIDLFDLSNSAIASLRNRGVPLAGLLSSLGINKEA